MVSLVALFSSVRKDWTVSDSTLCSGRLTTGIGLDLEETLEWMGKLAVLLSGGNKPEGP